MTNKETKISIRAYAKTLGASDKTIRNAIARKFIEKGVVYKPGVRMGVKVYIPEIIKEIADKEYGYLYKNDEPSTEFEGSGIS